MNAVSHKMLWLTHEDSHCSSGGHRVEWPMARLLATVLKGNKTLLVVIEQDTRTRARLAAQAMPSNGGIILVGLVLHVNMMEGSARSGLVRANISAGGQRWFGQQHLGYRSLSS